MDGFEQLAAAGTLIGGALLGIYRLMAGPREEKQKAQMKEVAKEVAEEMRQTMIGKGDPTPKHVRDRDTGAFVIAMRAELDAKLDPIINEQRRQGRVQDEHGQKLEVVTQAVERVTKRQHEMSAEMAQAKTKAELDALSERLGEN